MGLFWVLVGGDELYSMLQAVRITNIWERKETEHAGRITLFRVTADIQITCAKQKGQTIEHDIYGA